MKILLLGWRNLASATGEWQLIANRASSIFIETGVSTEAVVLVNLKKHKSLQPVRTVQGLNIQLIDSSIIKLPISLIRLYLIALRKITPQTHIIVSGIFSYPLLFLFKGIKDRVYIDLHGAYEELNEYAVGNLLFHRLLVKSFNKIEKIATKFINGRFVVSNYLADYSDVNYGHTKHFIVPCGVLNTRDQLAELHRKWREYYGWDGKQVWVYCGGLSRWQNVDLLIEEFAKIPNKENEILWLLSNEYDILQEKCKAAGILNERFKCEYLAPEELEMRLPAADIGFLLREENITNRVSFPNKFSQYVNAGLLTVLTRGVCMPADLGTQYKVSLVLDNIYEGIGTGIILEKIRFNAQVRSNDLETFYKRCNRLVSDKLLFSTTLTEFMTQVMTNMQCYFNK